MRNRNHGFNVKVEGRVNVNDADTTTLRIVGEISEYVPARFYLSNGDPGYPAEGGEIEEYKIFGPDGKEIEDPNGDILDAVMDYVLEKIIEDAASDQEDAREHARESREDR
jgi:hypothetical protein